MDTFAGLKVVGDDRLVGFVFKVADDAFDRALGDVLHHASRASPFFEVAAADDQVVLLGAVQVALLDHQVLAGDTDLHQKSDAGALDDLYLPGTVVAVEFEEFPVFEDPFFDERFDLVQLRPPA